MTKGKRQIPIDTPNSSVPQNNGQVAAEANVPSGQDIQDALASEQRDRAAEQEALLAEREALVAERDALLAERDSLLDSLLRLKAEFENYRKRACRDLAEAQGKGREELLAEFLPVLDNLERALEAAEHHEEGKVLEGVRLTRKMFVDLLNRCGIQEVEGVGACFDPQVHEAVTVQPSELEEGTVTTVLQRGYKQGDRLLRPARVVVSSGPGESQQEEQKAAAE